MPAPRLSPIKSSLHGTLELRRAPTPWIAAYYADGMTGGTLGSVIAAEAVLQGVDPYPAVARALRRYRVWNWAWYVETVKIPPSCGVPGGACVASTGGISDTIGWPGISFRSRSGTSRNPSTLLRSTEG